MQKRFSCYKNLGPTSLDGRAITYQSSDLLLHHGRKMHEFDFSNNSGKWNTIYYNNEKANCFPIKHTDGTDNVTNPTLQQQF